MTSKETKASNPKIKKDHATGLSERMKEYEAKFKAERKALTPSEQFYNRTYDI